MSFNKEKHHRRSIRLKDWDYSNAGAYFVTICTYKKECIFENDAIKQIIIDEWSFIPNRFKNSHVDEFIVMPNHLHGIIWIEPVGAGLALPISSGLALPISSGLALPISSGLALPISSGLALPISSGLALPSNKENTRKGGPRPAPTLGDIICAFKSKTTININRYCNSPGHPIWQRNYYEHIIRNEDELNHIRQYIHENPLKWDDDTENPKNIEFSVNGGNMKKNSGVTHSMPQNNVTTVGAGLALPSGSYKDPITKTLDKILPVNSSFHEIAQKRLDNLTKPQGSLGRLEEFAGRLVAITENPMPVLDKKVVFTFAGDHGVAEEGVSAFPKEVTPQMVFNFLKGGAGINVLARHAGAEVVVIDIGVDYDFETIGAIHELPLQSTFISKKIIKGTKNMRKGPAMTRGEAEKSINVGIELADEYAEMGYKIFGTGDMGIANTTPSAAIASVLTGRSVSEVTGKGTGIGDSALKNKVKVIEDAITLNKPDQKDPLDVLAKIGGAEIGGIAGLIIGASVNRVPVVIDGFISTAGALIAYCIEPKTKDYMFAAHKSVEVGHTVMLEKIGLRPILDLDLRLGEGTGAALAMLMIEAGLKIYKEMATFDEANVSK
jgi:nicotinate-nucleotide--dimethylbenzimidazole phosphoribosyltransferase